MSALSARVSSRVARVVCVAALLLSLVSVSRSYAQSSGTGHALHHDSSNPTPGHLKGKGKAHDGAAGMSMVSSGFIVSPVVQIATNDAVIGVRGMLRDRVLDGADGLRLSDAVQTDLAALLDGSSPAATLRLTDALARPDNGVASKEASRLVTMLARLPDAPDTFPATAVAYNDFIDRSSDAFVLDPPEEVLAIRAALFTVLEPMLQAVEGKAGTETGAAAVAAEGDGDEDEAEARWRL